MNKQNEKPGARAKSPGIQNVRQVSPVSNYVYLHWWHHFNWDLYVKILKAKELL